MRLFFDENMPQKVAAALQALGVCEAQHVLDELGTGTPDEEVFRFLSEKDWLLITQDDRIRRRPQQRRALLDAGLGVFILIGRGNKSVAGMMLFLLAHLEEMEERARRTQRPFIFGIPDRGKIERLG